MKKTSISIVGALVLSLVAIGTPAQADELSVTPGSIYIDLGLLENTLSADWTGDDQNLEHYAMSCDLPKYSAITTPAVVGAGNIGDCKELSSTDDELSLLDGSSFDLSTAYSLVNDSWVSFVPATHGRHIIMVTNLTDSSTDYFIHTKSSYLLPTEDVTPGSFSLDGSAVSHSNSVFSAEQGDEWNYLVACEPGTNPVVQTAPRLIGETLGRPSIGVTPLTEDAGNCGRLFDGNSNPTNPDSLVGGVLSSLENAEVHDGTEFVSLADSGRDLIALETFYSDNTSGAGEKWFTSTDFETYTPSQSENTIPTPPPGSISSPEPDSPFSAPAPFQGPVITAPSIASSAAPGSTITIPGENLDGVSAVSIGNTDAEVEATNDQLEVSIPSSLEAGTYDLVISSSTGNVTISDAITVSGVAVNTSEAPRGSTTRDDDEVKVRVFNPAGAGKVQIIVNGEEIAWVRTDDPNDPKLTNGYLVRTVELLPGKNVIEIFLDGERIRRNAYGL